jgi:hypothetical protein
MYPEAAIKALFPQNLCEPMVKIANKVGFAFDGRVGTK